MTLEELLARVKAHGLRLNNLCQLENGQWRANVRSDEATPFHEFGEGDSPTAALADCLGKIPVDRIVQAEVAKAIDQVTRGDFEIIDDELEDVGSMFE